MNPPSPATVTASNTNNKNGATAQAAPAPAPAPQPEKAAVKTAEKTKPVTVALSEDLHRKLKIVGFAKGMPISDLVGHYVEAALRKDLTIALSKLTDSDE